MPPPQKRTLEEAESFLDGVKVLLLDIEGTMCPINFVKDKLGPYITENIEAYLTNRYDEEETQKDIAALRDLATKDKEGGDESAKEIPAAADGNKEDVVKAVVANVQAQMTADRKSTELKQLQGHIWREAYKTKKCTGELFEDVYPVLQQLHDEDYKMYVYSSGSKESQELFFTHSVEGDIRECFSGYFDTTSGSKVESSSYKAIKDVIETGLEETDKPLEADDILFLTDNPAEATAAGEAGLRVVIVDRSEDPDQEGGFVLSEEIRCNFPVIDNFNDLFGDDEDDDDEFCQIKRPHMAGNGQFGGEEDDDEVDDEDLGGEDDDDDEEDVPDEEDEEDDAPEEGEGEEGE